MKLRTLVIASSLSLFLAACDSEPEAPAQYIPPLAEAVKAAPPEPEPIPAPVAEFPLERNAFFELKAPEHIDGNATFVIATANPTELFELLDAEEPDSTDYGPDHAPELLDLHPSRLKAMGLDATKPVGIAIMGKGDELATSTAWTIFASVEDEAQFRKAFVLGKKQKDGTFDTVDGDKRKFLLLDNGEVLIAARSTVEDSPRNLGEDGVFVRLRDGLDFGKLGSGYIKSSRGTSMFGLGMTPQGAGVKAVGEDELNTSSARLKFVNYLAGTYAELPYLQRVINMRAELMPAGRDMRTRITKIERAPLQRREDAARAMLKNFDEVASLDEQTASGLYVAGRIWKAKSSDIAKLFQAWQALGQTEEEIQTLDDIKTTLETMVVAGAMGPADFEALAEPGSAMHDAAMEFSKNATGEKGGINALSGMLGTFAGDSDGGKGGGGGGPMKMLGGLGNLVGGMGGSGDANITSRSSVPHLKNHGRRRMQPLAICWGRSEQRMTELTVSADLAVDVEGKVKIKRLSGVPDDMSSCIRQALGTRALAPEEPVEGRLKIYFKRK